MSIQTEITRIITDRNTIRTKLTGLGLATATDNLDELATKVNGITDRGTPEASIKEGETYTIQAGYYRGGSVTGIAGGGDYDLQAKSNITPTKSQQTITADFIPAKNPSGVVGMYDVVRNQFFTNAGAGSFIAGPEV